MTVEEKFFVEVLDFFRLGLNLSLVSKSEISEWADIHLLNNTLLAENDILIYLSLSHNISPKELSMFISEKIGIKSTILGSRFLLGKLQRLKNLEKIIEVLSPLIEWMALDEVEEELLESIDFHFHKNSQLWSMEKDYIEEVEKKVRLFFSFYKEYRIENLNKIKELNEQLSKKLFSFEGV